MNTLKSLLIIIFALAYQLLSGADLRVKPTFSSCGIYLLSNKASECRLLFKKTNEPEWKTAFAPVYDELNREYRGSIVRLDENTSYNVKIQLFDNGKMKKEFQNSFQTWTSDPVVSKTLYISDFKNKGNASYTINNVVGKEKGWIKIIGDVEVNALNTNEDYAIRITNSQYVILENITVKGGGKHGIYLPGTASQIRIINCDISGWGRVGIQNENGVYIDGNGNKINNDAGIRLEKNEDIVVERCYIHDPRAKTNSWSGVIQSGPFKGKSYEKTHPEGPNAIYCRLAYAGIVVRYNDLIGSQTHRYNDPFETNPNGDVDGGLNCDADVYGNVLAFGQDDGIELDGGQCNVRFYNNRVEQTLCGISVAPNRKGPSYIFNNVISNLGDATNTQSVAIKSGGGPTYTKGTQFFFNNTMVVLKNGIAGIGYGKDAQRELFIAKTRNNILMSNTKSIINGNKGIGLSIMDVYKSKWNDFDYDMISDSQNDGGKGVIQAKEGSEAHGTFALPQFTDLKYGVYTLKNNDPGIDKGLKINNYSEKYQGEAPDLGAFELGSSSLYPMRPVNIVSDKYQLKMKTGTTETIKLKTGDIGNETSFRIAKSEDMNWFTVSCNTNIIKSNSEITLNVEASKSETRPVGMFFIRLQNGFSVPISVVAE